MLDFVKNAFRNGITVILWVNLILSAIVGAIAGSVLGSHYTFLGLIIGSICGLLTNILGGGFITTILSIERNTEEQTALLKKHLGISSLPDDKHSEEGLKVQDEEPTYVTEVKEDAEPTYITKVGE